jgi:hypothetical protein
MPRQPLLNLRVDPDRKARWQSAADRADVLLSEWIRRACDSAVARQGSAAGTTPEATSPAGMRSGAAGRTSGTFNGPDPKPGAS